MSAPKSSSPIQPPSDSPYAPPPPPVSCTRLAIIASFWAVILLGVPYWWQSTSTLRLPLPENRIEAWTGREVAFPVEIVLAPGPDPPPVGDWDIFAGEVQALLAGKEREVAQAEEGELRLNWRVLVAETPEGRASQLHPNSYTVRLTSTPYPEITSHTVSQRGLHLALPTLAPPAQTLASHLHALIHPPPPSLRTAKYASHYRLVFSLMNQDAAAEEGGRVRDWEIEGAVEAYLAPLLTQLRTAHNLTIESQIVHYAPLSFSPKPLNSSVDGVEGFVVEPDELKVFVNSGEWSLASAVTTDPVLHLILYIPASYNSPLHIRSEDGSLAPSASFLLPQFGGVTLVHPSPHTRTLTAAQLRRPMQQIRTQLLTLLGVPSLPTITLSPSSPSSSSAGTLSGFSLDALLRLRTHANIGEARGTLGSVVKVVRQIREMRVGGDVRGQVEGALGELELAVRALDWGGLEEAVRHSARALELAEKAFFNPGMLALLYFPDEHKYAVYTPLFGPVAVPLVLALVREGRAWRDRRRRRRENGGKEE